MSLQSWRHSESGVSFSREWWRFFCASWIQRWTTTHRIAIALDWPNTIEIAEKTVLSLPFGFGHPPSKFSKEGGIIHPTLKQAKTKKNRQTMMMCWKRSFEQMGYLIEGKYYKGFELWKKVYEAFPEYANMTEKQARKQGIYPEIFYYNSAGREWMATYHGGHLADLNNLFEGELWDIWQATEGKGTIKERLAAIRQAPIGWYHANSAYVIDIGNCSCLASTSLNSSGRLRCLGIYPSSALHKYVDWQMTGMPCMVVINRVTTKQKKQ